MDGVFITIACLFFIVSWFVFGADSGKGLS